MANKLFLVGILISFLSSLEAYTVKKKKLRCKRGVLRIVSIEGKKRYTCVIKKEKVFIPSPTPLEWNARWWGRLGLRPSDGPLLATNRYRFESEASKGLAPWISITLGGRITHDLMSNFQGNNFRDDFSQNRKPELELWNAFTEFDKGSWRIRLGQQQVAWGEAFGFFYADIVNPKDTRERSLGKLADLRLPVPMANFQWSNRNLSIQALWLPFFRPDRNATTKSDFFPDPSELFNLPAGTNFNITKSWKEDDSRGDYGGRISSTIKGVDFSLLYFNHLDRLPYFEAISGFQPGGTFLLRPHHSRIQSTGLTFSTEIEGYIIRSENLYTPQKKLNYLNNNILSNNEFTNIVHVLGIDLPKWHKYQLRFQGSIDSLNGSYKPLLRDKQLTLGSIHLLVDLPYDAQLETNATVETKHLSSIFQLKYLRPLNNQYEWEIATDLFNGTQESFFGQVHKASRVYMGIKGAFDG